MVIFSNNAFIATRMNVSYKKFTPDDVFDYLNIELKNASEQTDIDNLNKIWDYVKNDLDECYYFNPYGSDYKTKFFKFCPVIIMYATEKENEELPVYEECTMSDFVSLYCLCAYPGSIVTATDTISKQFDADVKNMRYKYRRFQCQICGRMTYADKCKDEWMLRHNCLPNRNCALCIDIRKHKQETKRFIDG